MLHSHSVSSALLSSWPLVSVLVTFLALDTFAEGQTTASEAVPTDAEISKTVRRRIAQDDTVHLDNVKTVTADGIVTLIGTVDNLLAKLHATHIAESVRGTRAVVNRLELKTLTRPDAELLDDLQVAFVYNPTIEANDIEIRVDEGVVKLAGTVQSRAEADVASQVAAGVVGVKEVNSQITFKQREKRSDDEIMADVRSRLHHNAKLNAEHIVVNVDDGEVRLRGTVPTAAQRQIASNLAFVSGASEVLNSELKVDPALEIGVGRQQLEARNDIQIRQAIQAALKYDPRVEQDDIQVIVEKGLVTLTGNATTLEGKFAAKQDAENTVGVWRVEEQIEVRPTADKKDEAITQDILAAFRRDAYLSEENISVQTTDGFVVLQGRVATQTKRERAERLAREVRGASSVANNLSVNMPKPDAVEDPVELEYRIKNRLYWNPLFDDCDIEVIVAKDGTATLTGWVGDQIEFQTAKRIALDAGATQVNNRLLIGKNPKG